MESGGERRAPAGVDAEAAPGAYDLARAARAEIRAALLGWYRANRRDLPWRDTRDPYMIWVSEVMLQQTRVATVLEYYRRWMLRFPTLEDLAAASLDEVLGLWSGLGYYRRARYLHEASQQVADQLGGKLPSCAAELRKLKGVGEYTAGAIASIAFAQPVAAVDGNVERVLARLRAIPGDLSRGAPRKLLRRLAAELVDPQDPGDFNQALMELGATVCTPRQPGCEGCPVRAHCLAYQAGRPTDFPTAAARPTQRPVQLRCAVVVREGARGAQFLVCQRPADGIWGGLWEFPTREMPDELSDVAQAKRMQELLRRLLGCPPQPRTPVRPLGSFVHHFTHRRIAIDVELWALAGAGCAQMPSLDGLAGEVSAARWVEHTALEALGMSAAMRKVLAIYRAQMS